MPNVGDPHFRLRPEAERPDAPLPVERKSYFKTILAGDLQAKDLMPLRAKYEEGFREYYLNRSHLDEPLSRNCAIGQHTLIAGMPLAGKTRAVLHFLKNATNPELPVLLPEDIPVSKEDFFLPDVERAVVVLDELDTFLAGEHRDWLLQQLLSSGRFFVVAICWTEQVDSVRDKIARFFHKFEVLHVPPLTAGEKKEVLTHGPQKRFFRSDATIGSYFLPLHEMKKRFDSLPASSLEREILRSCKVLFIWKRQISFAAYDKAEVREYVQKRRQHHYGRTGPVFPAQWEEVFANLQKKQLIVEEEDRILVEEAYLNEFVPDGRDAIAGEYVRYFPELSVHHKAISICSSFAIARWLFEQWKKEGLSPNVFVFNSLINKADSWAAAQGILEEMKKAGVKPDHATKGVLEKAARKNPAAALHDILNGAPENELFTNRLLNYVLLEVCFGEVDEAIFFKQFGSILLKRDDAILRYFAEKLKAPAHRIALAEALREKDWNYWKIMGDSQIPGDWKQAESYLKTALEKAPANFHPLLWGDNVGRVSNPADVSDVSDVWKINTHTMK
ncbi:MAG: hypothetical protein EPO28_07920 [Saprospiraceae bacterium]|nr:MAG: hypothetical protein EPO28_07920 [Saprospiraceae bacterium]